MAAFLWPLLSGALGAIQGGQQRQAQQKANQAQAELAAVQTQYSPWTGMQAQPVKFEAPQTSALQGGIQGGLAGLLQNQANPEAKAPMAKPLQPGSDSSDYDNPYFWLGRR